MYKIFINGRPLFILKPEDLPSLPSDPTAITGRYTGKSKTLMQYVDTLEKSSRYAYVALTHHDPKAVFDALCGYYKILEAAGGVIRNHDNQVFFIERLGKWDLPKGKVDPGETIEQAAIREVLEETGLETSIEQQICTTYHTYTLKNQRVLKPTHWFAMVQTGGQVKLQSEEDITDYTWFDNSLKTLTLDTYPNIHQVWQAYQDSISRHTE
jgi:8-oxo-dGTP pyrophosphatase MutT (NUDIX family)